jgi:KDO2-lipid IV(A) lauroyltransferase
VRRAAAEAFRCQALNYIDLMRVDRITPDELDASVVRGDLSPFAEVMARGKGAIILSGHVGNMDYVAQWLSLHGYRVESLMERLEPERLFRLVQRQRAATGLRLHALAPEAIGLLARALREGQAVALIADRDIGGTGELVEFFGAEARLPVGPALLALRTGAPLMAAFGRRLPDNRLYVSVRPPVYLERTRDLRADLRAGLRVTARLLEEGIAKAPQQWVVFEPIWKGEAA